MPISITYNVDTVEFTVPCEDPLLPDEVTVTGTTPDGEITFRNQNRQIVRGKDSVHNITVRPNGLKKLLAVSGSPFGFAYGQNVYMPGSVREACWEALIGISDRLSMKPTYGKMKRKLSQIVLSRVDLAIHFQFRNLEEVIAFIEQLKSQLAKQRVHVHSYATGLHWLPSKGEEYSIRIYAKGPEMALFDPAFLSPDEKRLVEESGGILRVELQLRGRALRKHGLVNPSAWTRAKTEEVFRHYFGLLPLSNASGGPIAPTELEKLTKSLKPVLIAWASGAILADVFPNNRTRAGYIRDLKECGWDITQEYTGDAQVIQVKDLLDLSRAVKEPPAWLKSAGLYPEE